MAQPELKSRTEKMNVPFPQYHKLQAQLAKVKTELALLETLVDQAQAELSDALMAEEAIARKVAQPDHPTADELLFPQSDEELEAAEEVARKVAQADRPADFDAPLFAD
jgi:hypothetical protein